MFSNLIITVFKTVKFPAGISNLAASLADVDRDTLSLIKENVLNNTYFISVLMCGERRNRKKGVVMKVVPGPLKMLNVQIQTASRDRTNQYLNLHLFEVCFRVGFTPSIKYLPLLIEWKA